VALITIPGPVDPHVHLRDLDWTHKATVERETAAALAGGYWAVLDMPNTPPPTTTLERLQEKEARFSDKARCDYGLYLGADQRGNERDYVVAAPLAVGLKMYCDQTTGDLLIDDDTARRAHMLAWGAVTSRPLAVHAEGATLERVLRLARETGVRVHFCHVSTAAEVEMLGAAKRDGVQISVGVTPHHLYLTADDADRLGAYGKVKPPLQTRADTEALWRGLADRTVDVIESDHAPHATVEKDSAMPPHGLPGLETTLPLMGLAVRDGRISVERLIELVATTAQQLFGLEPPAGTATVLDTDASWVIDDADLLTSPGWSPFAGMRVQGRVREVRIGGELAYDGEQVLADPGSGRNVTWS
jgi:dihydroorotase-like cyclic amidohydrolase